MAESFKTKLLRWGFNHIFIPAYRRCGARITYVDDSWREVHIKLPLTRKTRNYVGTTFGGSLYAAVDPIYMFMLLKILGPGYRVWDKQAVIRFLKPGRSTLYAVFRLSEEEIDRIRGQLETQESLERIYQVELVDHRGVAHVAVEKTVHIRRKRATA